MDNIFDVINTKLFSPLASKDKRTNYELLMHLYELFCKGEARPYIPKEEVVSSLASYIKHNHFDEICDDEDADIAYKTAREKATLKVRQFKKAGYLVEDTTDGFETNLSIDGDCILLLERFEEVAKRGKGQMEYTGYVYAVYSMCMQFDFSNFSNSYQMLQQVEERTRALMNGLQGLNSKIRRYIENLMTNPKLSPRQIYQIVLVEYQNDVLFTLFNNIKSKDNPDRYSDFILDTMKRFADSCIPEIRQNMMETTNDNDYSSAHIAEVDARVLKMIEYVIHSFNWMQGLLEYIDRNNNRYLNTAKGKLNFILNEEQNVEGRLLQALRGLKHVPEDYDYDELIKIRRAENIDDKSSFAPRFIKEKVTSVAFESPELTPEELALGQATIFAEDRFSRSRVEERALAYLGNRDCIQLKDMHLETFDDLLFIFLMQVYSETNGLRYEVEPEEEVIHVMKYRLRNFTLYRKES